MKKWSIALASLLFATSAFATPALTFNEASGVNGDNQGQSVGWRFTVLSSVSVNELGWYDQGQDGLGHEHMVGLWDPSGTLLASALVPGGTVAGLDGVYRMVAISAITLTPGVNYVVGGENFDTSGDRLAANVTQAIDAHLSFGDATFSSLGSGFVRPDQDSSATTGFYGPMFGITAEAPEPATVALMALGLAGIGFRRRTTR